MKLDPKHALALRLAAADMLQSAAKAAAGGQWLAAFAHSRDANDLLQLAHIGLSGHLDEAGLAVRHEQLKARSAKRGPLAITWSAALNALRPYLEEATRDEAEA